MAKEKIKIAMIGGKSFPSITGVDRVIEAVSISLSRRKNYEISIYCDDQKIDNSVAVENIEIIPIKTFGKGYFKAIVLFLKGALHALIFGNYDVVHVHNLEAAFILPILKIRFPIVSTSHMITYRRNDQWGGIERELLKISEWLFILFSDICTSVSKPDTQYFNKKYKKSVIWVPNGVENVSINNDEKKDLLEKFRLKENDYLIFTAGRIIPSKGCHLVLEAIEICGITLPFIILGNLERDMKYAEKIKSMAGPNTAFIPFIRNKKDIYSLVKGAKLMIFPSYVEGMSMVLLEAATVGSNIIASDIPENKVILGPECVYFKSGSVSDLASQIEYCLENYDVMQEKSARVSEYVRDNFSWKNIVDKYDDIYLTLLR